MFAAHTKALRSRLYGERNGIVADTMRHLGLSYRENWGVSLWVIRKIARETRAALLDGIDDSGSAHPDGSEDLSGGVGEVHHSTEPACGGVGKTYRETDSAYFVHLWARELWRSSSRELRIAALWLADPPRMAVEADFWQRGLDTPELVDEFAFALRTRKI